MNKNTIQSILERAQYFNQKKKNRKNTILKDNLVINLFFENSTRTKASFEIAAKSMSADILNISVSSSSIKKGETLIDTAATLNAMHPDFLILRHPNSGAAEMLSKHVECSIINAGDGRHEHPTQALLDAFTLKSKLGSFSNKNIFLFLGGFILALSIQKSNLHERIALGILRYSGKNGPTLIAGFMGVSAFLSMWMMNTSTTLMLLPIGISVATIAQQNIGKDINKNNGFATALMLGIAYSATIGGMTTLIGTAPNAVFASFIEENY